MMFYAGILVGVIIAFGIVAVFVAAEDVADARQIYKDGARGFAKRLKLRIWKSDYPWEDCVIFASDVDEVLKEMESEY